MTLTTARESDALDNTTRDALDQAFASPEKANPTTTHLRVAPRPVDVRTGAEPGDSKLDKIGNTVELSPIENEITRNRTSYNAARLQLVEKHTNSIKSMELQVEKLVAGYNVEKAKADSAFLSCTDNLREQLSILVKQIEAINSQIEREEQRYEDKCEVIEDKFKDSMENLTLLLESESASLAVLTRKDRPPSPFSESALAQTTLPEDTRKPKGDFAESMRVTTQVTQEVHKLDIS